MPQRSLHTPVFDLTVFEHDGAIVALEWGWVDHQDDTPLLREAKIQIDRFFDQGGTQFDLPLKPRGTGFELSVWRKMETIPVGETRSYQDIASAIGSVPRAVGRAAGKNPIPLLIPCHRVLGANGSMTGYSGEGGLDTKQDLLIIEGALPPRLL